jgi:hypothetical protein
VCGRGCADAAESLHLPKPSRQPRQVPGEPLHHRGSKLCPRVDGWGIAAALSDGAEGGHTCAGTANSLMGVADDAAAELRGESAASTTNPARSPVAPPRPRFAPPHPHHNVSLPVSSSGLRELCGHGSSAHRKPSLVRSSTSPSSGGGGGGAFGQATFGSQPARSPFAAAGETVDGGGKRKTGVTHFGEPPKQWPAASAAASQSAGAFGTNHYPFTAAASQSAGAFGTAAMQVRRPTH